MISLDFSFTRAVRHCKRVWYTLRYEHGRSTSVAYIFIKQKKLFMLGHKKISFYNMGQIARNTGFDCPKNKEEGLFQQFQNTVEYFFLYYQYYFSPRHT